MTEAVVTLRQRGGAEVHQLMAHFAHKFIRRRLLLLQCLGRKSHTFRALLSTALRFPTGCSALSRKPATVQLLADRKMAEPEDAQPGVEAVWRFVVGATKAAENLSFLDFCLFLDLFPRQPGVPGRALSNDVHRRNCCSSCIQDTLSTFLHLGASSFIVFHTSGCVFAHAAIGAPVC